eukprot:4296035-Pleurochrysis_carterae.AAC.1
MRVARNRGPKGPLGDATPGGTCSGRLPTPPNCRLSTTAANAGPIGLYPPHRLPASLAAVATIPLTGVSFARSRGHALSHCKHPS